MAKKKPAPWSMGTDTTKSAAKESIKKTTPPKPKKPQGRPKVFEGEEIDRVQVTKSAKNKAKVSAAQKGITLIEYLSNLILNDK